MQLPLTTPDAPAGPLIATLWEDWRCLAPQADRVRALLTGRGEPFVVDHLALRTFDHPALGLDALVAPFVAAGYRPMERYRFASKHLRARYWSPRTPDLPRVFASELVCGELSRRTQDRIAALVDTMSPDAAPALPSRPWRPTRADFDALASESEYAAWLCAFGLRANHFTVSVNALSSFADIPALNAFLVANGLPLNTSGGAVKGGPDQGLAQSSTRAAPVTVQLEDGPLEVLGCYVEFALRYRGADGELFDGFVTGSADRIFESTDRR